MQQFNRIRLPMVLRETTEKGLEDLQVLKLNLQTYKVRKQVKEKLITLTIQKAAQRIRKAIHQQNRSIQ